MNAMLKDSGFQGFSLRKKPGTKNRYEVVRDGNKPVKRLSEGVRNFIAFLYFYHLASSMLSYIDNECSFIDGFNLVQESMDPEQYRKVMKKIFEKLDQSQHYRMMTHEKV